MIQPLLSSVKRLIISSGHIYWLKLATGQVDIYLDPIGGERLYEMFACMVAIKSGSIVTDLSKKPFDPSKMLTTFEENSDYIYYPVASNSRELHKQITTILQGQSL